MRVLNEDRPGNAHWPDIVRELPYRFNLLCVFTCGPTHTGIHRVTSPADSSRDRAPKPEDAAVITTTYLDMIPRFCEAVAGVC